MAFPAQKTKLVCTIGPASRAQATIEEMIRAGMDVARLNFSHGELETHAEVIRTLHAAQATTGRRVAVLADLPGPKIRVGKLATDPMELTAGRPFALTADSDAADDEAAPVTFPGLARAVKAGDALFLNDGFIQLRVVRVNGQRIECRVEVGGELRSGKGLNVPGIDLGIDAFTQRDRECLAFALGHGVDAISQSFVQTASDVRAVRDAAAALGSNPFLIAKIERSVALDHIDEILDAADGIMIARGDLGVETPIEQIAIVQKRLVHEANRRGKPVITATQMLESMTAGRQPTRAEATDVANAILDGTDCVMLSAESATGRYPVDAVRMLAAIAAATEPYRRAGSAADDPPSTHLRDLIAASVQTMVERCRPAAVVVPTISGATALSILRHRPSSWIIAVSPNERTCQALRFGYGIHPVHEPDYPSDWCAYVRRWVEDNGVPGELVLLTEGPSPHHPEANHRIEVITIRPRPRAR